MWPVLCNKKSILVGTKFACSIIHENIIWKFNLIFLWVYIWNTKQILKISDNNLLHWKLSRNWNNIYALFNEHFWCSCPMCVKYRRCSAPGGHVNYFLLRIIYYWVRLFFFTLSPFCSLFLIEKKYWIPFDGLIFYYKSLLFTIKTVDKLNT